MVENFVDRMEKFNIEVEKPRFFYYVLYIHGETKVFKRMKLVHLFDPLKDRIDKFHYIQGIIPILAVLFKCSKPEAKKWLEGVVDRNRNKRLDEGLDLSGKKGKKRKKEYDILDVTSRKKQTNSSRNKITTYFKLIKKDNNDFFEN